MANFGKLLLTNSGLLEQSKAQAGTPLKFKRIAMGSGSYSGNILTLTRIVKEEVSVDISKGYIQNGAYTVEGFFSNQGLQTGFAWREIGLIVENANGDEVLYCYANAGDTYDYIPATEDERYSKNIRIATVIGNATNVSIVESEGILYVDTITFNTAVEEFRTDISQLWSSKLISGSTLLANDSAELPFVGMKIYGKSTQFTTTGKNLVDLSGFEFDDSSYTHVFNSSHPSAKALFEFLKQNTGKNIVTSLKSKGTPSGVGIGEIRYFDSNNELICAILPEVIHTIIEMPDTFSACYVYGSSSGASAKDFQIEYGDVSTEYEPYSGGAPSPSPDYPQEIVNVGDNSGIGVKVFGKNLWTVDNTSANNISYDADNQIFTISGAANATLHELPIPIPKGTVVTITANILSGVVSSKGDGGLAFGGYNKSEEVATWQGYINIPKMTEANISGKVYTETFKTTADVTHFYAFVYASTATIHTPLQMQIQYEINDTASPYELHKDVQAVNLSTPNGLAGIPVSSGGNYTDDNGQQWVCDEIDLERGVYVQRVLCETLTMTLVNSANNITDIYGANMSKKMLGKTSVGLCSHMAKYAYNTSDEEHFYISDASTAIRLFVLKGTKITDVTFAGILYEPIETSLTDEEIAAYEALNSNNPATTILNDSGAGMNARYITKSHEPVFKKIFKKMAALEEAILSGLDEIIEAQENLIEEE